MMAMGNVELLILAGLAIVMLIPSWRIVAKTGFPGVLALLFFIPIGNLVLLFVLAFAKWPIQKELDRLRAD